MQTTPRLNPTNEHRAKMTELIMGFVPAQAVYVAAELGIADLISQRPMSAEELATSTGTQPRMLFRLLRFLCSMGIFDADENKRFSLTPMGSLLRSDAGGSMRSMSRTMGHMGPRTS